jgi:hypothetical protein
MLNVEKATNPHAIIPTMIRRFDHDITRLPLLEFKLSPAVFPSALRCDRSSIVTDYPINIENSATAELIEFPQGDF